MTIPGRLLLTRIAELENEIANLRMAHMTEKDWEIKALIGNLIGELDERVMQLRKEATA